jgi:hypothetical protein
MPVLLINGTLNQETFANAVSAAHFDSRRKTGRGLDAVLVVHSLQSLSVLNTKQEWRNALNDNGLSAAIFHHTEVDIEGDPNSVLQLAAHIERFITIVSPSDKIYVDLTNGQSLQKAALGAVAYVLGAKEQFIINTRLAGKSPRCRISKRK